VKTLSKPQFVQPAFNTSAGGRHRFPNGQAHPGPLPFQPFEFIAASAAQPFDRGTGPRRKECRAEGPLFLSGNVTTEGRQTKARQA